MRLFPGVSTVDLLAKGMSVAQDNHRLIANNIANADTPGYRPVNMDFHATLRDAIGGGGRISLRNTRPRHLQASLYRPIEQSFRSTSKNDKNMVDLEMQIASLSENTGRYTVYSSILTKQIQMTKNMLTNTR